MIRVLKLYIEILFVKINVWVIYIDIISIIFIKYWYFNFGKWLFNVVIIINVDCDDYDIFVIERMREYWFREN